MVLTFILEMALIATVIFEKKRKEEEEQIYIAWLFAPSAYLPDKRKQKWVSFILSTLSGGDSHDVYVTNSVYRIFRLTDGCRRDDVMCSIIINIEW